MPFKKVWVEPEVALDEFCDVTVYHSYKDGSKMMFWYTLDVAADDENDGTDTWAFDIRAVAKRMGLEQVFDQYTHRQILIYAVLTGCLKPLEDECIGPHILMDMIVEKFGKEQDD